MPDVSRVAGRADNRNDSKTLLRPETGLQEVVDHLGEGRQLIEVHKLCFKAAVLEPVRFILAVPEHDLAAIDQPVLMPPCVVGGDGFRIRGLRLLDVRVLQLCVGPPEDHRRGSRVLQRPEQRVHDQRLGLPAASGPAVQDLVCLAGVEHCLLRRRLVIDHYIRHQAITVQKKRLCGC